MLRREFASRDGSGFTEIGSGKWGRVIAVESEADTVRIGSLHLGVKTPLLEAAGFQTFADVRSVQPEEIMRIRSVGRSTADELVRNRTAMMSALGDDGSIDWEVYCAGLDIPLIPTNRSTSGAAFLAGLPQFFDELALALDDTVKVSILQERICQPPQSQKTLEQIAQTLVRPVSREWIRQLEAKLLNQITGGLLNDAYNGLDIHFHPDFS